MSSFPSQRTHPEELLNINTHSSWCNTGINRNFCFWRGCVPVWPRGSTACWNYSYLSNASLRMQHGISGKGEGLGCVDTPCWGEGCLYSMCQLIGYIILDFFPSLLQDLDNIKRYRDTSKQCHSWFVFQRHSPPSSVFRFLVCVCGDDLSIIVCFLQSLLKFKSSSQLPILKINSSKPPIKCQL